MLSVTSRLAISAIVLQSLWVSQSYADSFTDALAYTYANNPTIQAERKELEATDEGASQAFSGFLPNARAEYNRGYDSTNIDRSARRAGPLDNKALTVTQPLFNGQSIAHYS